MKSLSRFILVAIALLAFAQFAFADNSSALSCYDSDGGLNIYVNGTTILSNSTGIVNTATEYCVNSTSVREFDCSADNQSIVFSDYACPSWASICSQGACVNSTGSWCSDSDGGLNIFVKGTVNLSNSSSYTDYCANSTSVVEFDCLSNQSDTALSGTFACPSGMVCSDGACKTPSSPLYCIDTDRGNLFVKGTTYLVNTSNNAIVLRHTDYCSNSTNVNDYACATDNQSITSESYIPCPTGSTCSQGACVNTTPPIELLAPTGPYLFHGSFEYGSSSQPGNPVASQIGTLVATTGSRTSGQQAYYAFSEFKVPATLFAANYLEFQLDGKPVVVVREWNACKRVQGGSGKLALVKSTGVSAPEVYLTSMGSAADCENGKFMTMNGSTIDYIVGYAGETFYWTISLPFNSPRFDPARDIRFDPIRGINSDAVYYSETLKTSPPFRFSPDQTTGFVPASAGDGSLSPTTLLEGGFAMLLLAAAYAVMKKD